MRKGKLATVCPYDVRTEQQGKKSPKRTFRLLNERKNKMRKKKYKESNLFGCSTHWKLEFRFAHVQHWNKFPRLAFAYPITDNINNNNKTFHCCFFCLGCVLLNAFHMLLEGFFVRSFALSLGNFFWLRSNSCS